MHSSFHRNSARAGGMLSAWLRAKFPTAVAGALAASAPFAFVGTSRSPYAFMDTVEEAYRQADSNCPGNIQGALKGMASAGTTISGRTYLYTVFNLCSALNSQADVDALINYVTNGLVGA